METPWPVALLSTKIRDYIDRLGTVWVEGELTQWGVSGGNVYGKLKDLHADVTVSFQLWSSVRATSQRDLQAGRQGGRARQAQLLDQGRHAHHAGRARCEHVGLGDLLERLERLRRQLAGEGLFDAARKKPLPFLPHCIGLITGKDSDAEKDVLRNAQLRWPAVDFRVVHAAVQGDRRAAEVTAAIARLDADPEVDVIIVARGGGDFQNLLGFSDETRASGPRHPRSTPIVSAIGHEADRPLLDDVADLRASTPTDAAKRVVPDVADELARVQQARARLGTRLTHLLTHEIDRIGQLRSRPVLARPRAGSSTSAPEDLTRYVARGTELLDRTVERAQAARPPNSARTSAPCRRRRTLDRGYAIAQLPDGHVLRRADQAPAGTPLVLTLADGVVGADSTGPATRGSAAASEPSASEPSATK